jgi:hypothetical protein
MSARPPPCTQAAAGGHGRLPDARLDSASSGAAPAGLGDDRSAVHRLVQQATAPGSAWIAHATGPAAVLAYLAAVAGCDDVELDARRLGSRRHVREPATATFALADRAAALSILEDSFAEAQRLVLLVDGHDAGKAMRLLRGGETRAALRMARLAVLRTAPGRALVVAAAPPPDGFDVERPASLVPDPGPASATHRRRTRSRSRGLSLLAAALAVATSTVALAVAHTHAGSALGAAGAPPTPDPFPPLNTSVATYDGRSGQVVVLGCCDPGPGGVQRMSTWVSLGAEWRHVRVSSAPPWRESPGFAADPGSGDLLLQGGAGHHDTWAWNGHAWTELSIASPSPEGRLTMVADPTTRKLVALAVGSGPAEAGTWSWDGGAWTHLASRPPALGPIAYDPAARRVVSLIDAPEGAPDEQTWAFDGATWARVATPDQVAVEFYSSASGVPDQMAADFATRSVVYVEQASASPDSQIPGSTFVWAAGAWSHPPASIPLERQGLLVARAPAGRPLLLSPQSTGAVPDIWRWTGAQWTPLEQAS